MKTLLKMAFGFAIGFPYGIYYTVEKAESDSINLLIKTLAYMKGLIE